MGYLCWVIYEGILNLEFIFHSSVEKRHNLFINALWT